MYRLNLFTAYRLGLIVTLTLTLFACSGGGGCSGCAGCGITPIPGGFDPDQRIPNSAQVRLTSSGVNYVEDNIDPIVATFLPDGLDFPIPRSSFDVSVLGSATVCPDSDCVAHLEIRSLELTPTAPNILRARTSRSTFQSRDTAETTSAGSADYLGM
ncbi:MAG: hypothetical protein R3B82_27570 [Sandaracinaceae bacterium]